MLRNKEIGSEFWLTSASSATNSASSVTKSPTNEVYVLSGRTAIDVIIQDIQKTRKVRNVYLPAYCCDSMIDPFLRNGIEVELYDICYGDGLQYLVEEDKQCDIFYVTNYFGYESTISNEVITHFRLKGTLIIYDKTHSLFMSNDPTDALADYTFASIRKWMGVIAGAVVNKKDGTIDASLNEYPYQQCKIEAMREKARFINGDATVDKHHFLNKYGEFGHHLSEEYQGYGMDETSVRIWRQTDKVQLREARRANAAMLHIVLHNELSLHFLGTLSANCCPLFVPILFNTTEERDAVRKHLTENQIYCPIHWPKNKFITPEMHVNKIFDRELSLVCDQRYDVEDMERIVKFLRQAQDKLRTRK